jgi:hypothetical protein
VKAGFVKRPPSDAADNARHSSSPPAWRTSRVRSLTRYARSMDSEVMCSATVAPGPTAKMSLLMRSMARCRL